MNVLRGSLDNGVEQVSQSVREKSDWRYYVRNYPWLTLGVAATVGYLVVPRRVKVERVERIVPDAEALAELARQQKLVVAPKAQAPVAEAGIMDGIAGKLLSVALAVGSRAAMDFVTNKLSGMPEKKTGEEKAPSPTYAGSRPR